MSEHALIASVGALIALAGCTTSVTIGSDDPRTYPDGAARVPCGRVDCDPGKVCCNAICGVCAAFGSCPSSSSACVDAASPCGADRVSLTGSPVCSSYVWNGLDCTIAYGCSCAGDCTLPQGSYAACMERHAMCWSPVCSPSLFCPHGYFCAYTDCNPMLPGACQRIPADCSSTRDVAGCGCDGIAYRSACEAAHSGSTLMGGPATCGICNAPDLVITAGCSTSLGWIWDGRGCVEQIGCMCGGACDRLEPTQAACNARYSSVCTTLFPCGSTSCVRNAEYCQHGPMPDSCPAAPPECSGAPTCACIRAARGAGTACVDQGMGAIVYTP